MAPIPVLRMRRRLLHATASSVSRFSARRAIATAIGAAAAVAAPVAVPRHVGSWRRWHSDHVALQLRAGWCNSSMGGC